MASLTVGSLFSGIGGIDLGLERAGHRIVWHSEIDKYATRVLAKWWPNVPNLGDITKIKWNPKEHYVDIIAGGYPCQPFSTAGKRKGKEDPRHLWPYFLNAIRTIRPRYALMENVRGHLTLGFGDVLADLAACGYSAEWQIIPASSVGAPHRRDRLFIVAYSSFIGGHGRGHLKSSGETRSGSALQGQTRGSTSSQGVMADAENVLGDVGHNNSRVGMESETLPESGDGSWSSDMAYSDRERSHQAEIYSAETGKSALRHLAGRGRDDLGKWWQTEPAVGRMADGVPARVDRLRGLGNAVVPQLAELIGILISEHADN